MMTFSCGMQTPVVEARKIFAFWSFFRKIFTYRPLGERISEMDPMHGAKPFGAVGR
jgi:hypothetical protein